MMLNSPEQYCQVGATISNFVRPFSELNKCTKLISGQRFGPVPNLFKWLHRQIVNLERLHESNQLYAQKEQRDSVEIALKPNEQNVEIIYDGDEYYFDVVNNFNIASDGIKAWLSKDIEAKLVFKPAKTWINGCKTHYCLMCNLFSPHLNFIMLHMIFTCPKLVNKINKQTLSLENEKNVNNNNNNNKQRTETNSNRNSKKRGGFDIQSLLNARQEDDDDESIDVETCEDSEILDVGIEDQILSNKRQSLLNEYKQSAFKKLKTSGQPVSNSPNTVADINMNIMPNLASLYSQFGPTLLANTFANFITNQSLSPFALEPTNSMMTFPLPSQSSLKQSPGLANIFPHQAKHHSPQQKLCTSPSYSETSTQSLASSSLSPNISQKARPETKSKREKPIVSAPENAAKWTSQPEIVAEGNSPSTCGAGLPPYYVPPTNNPLLSSIYLLSPSLTALSFQASNVCAHCQTAFRMTSDLVYHMRSHHKNVKEKRVGESNKKKRGEMLRCTICDETFRERHHLTRHMTSHQ